ncbi:UDP-N-acetylglucosamine pyrophosphorylase [Candidatus Arthromitus sp. SFB-mouse-Japan]|uniref:bifunctional UDP-N-acetylglucosamine diphosphorylase/glucosamine-1-phosphate N-acetyltransferase GlmU n=1 Tax=Candidatus Arthromitus sp. SFB-mouse TaxID=49118 RepID=UPI00021B818A|nr:bifunctional UDP-N-acetylglucosamine diphosphorylase/glucosamine-1-phosphate N-acetyltransferase GlmU [Candidatus Arthromitus sp. SFB-mouse]BAK57213.1 UDP-N-acetylglucosamine pyrophosphorylase [Candidatus Arthromitus sp. SFB-mouse-Japan]
MNVCAIILAAGRGSRMKSTRHKATHKICGKEMINIIIDKLELCGIKDINVIIGEHKESLVDSIGNRNVSYSIQEKQLGTADAVLCAEKFWGNKSGDVLVIACDMPLIKEENIKKLIERHISDGNSSTIITSELRNPLKYGRVIRGKNGIERIKEAKDCSESELMINEINSSIYCFKIDDLRNDIRNIGKINNQGEFYLTDIIEIFSKSGKKIGSVKVDENELVGVDTRRQLWLANSILRSQINDKHMENGVTIIDSDSTYIDSDVRIESDVIIHANVYLKGNTLVKEGSEIYPNTRISNSFIGKDCIIDASIICDSKVGNGTNIGPFAYVRPGSLIGDNVKLGDFVEIKNSVIGNRTKIPHLSYIGDSEVGERCNLGCSTITVNYNGKNKNKTIIGNDCFIGCNSNLIAPVVVEENSYVAAGTTITEKVKSNSLAIGRCKQVNKENWVTNKFK